MLDRVHARAESLFQRRQRQATEGEQAWSEYKAKEAAAAANLERLRNLPQVREAQKKPPPSKVLTSRVHPSWPLRRASQ
jgi:hypothetical protein